jgi:hypothetical protein
MRAKLNPLSAFAVGIVGGALVAACQTYDFEPVEPLALGQTTVANVVRAKASKPNMMVLLDTSGSMTLPTNDSDPDCVDPSSPATPPANNCGNPGNIPCDVSRCPTRWSELRSAMSTFLASSGSIARMGLTTYPAPLGGTTAEQCRASSAVRIPIPQVEDSDTTSLQRTATDISNVILSIALNGPGGPAGGTPTSLSLRFVGDQPDLATDDRDDFILLLTDGLPNCNPSNPNNGTSPNCNCTLTACTGGASTLGCLDRDASVTAITDLRAKNIRTIVIGFGGETARGSGPATLNAMAEAGGFARNCAKSADACGPTETCDSTTKLCTRRFYQAANQAELTSALREIIDRVSDTDPCLLAVDENQLPKKEVDGKLVLDESLVVVLVNKQALEPGGDTWNLTNLGIQFNGSTCDRIKASTDANPVEIEARVVQKK